MDANSAGNFGEILIIVLLPFFLINGSISSLREVHEWRETNPAKAEMYKFLSENSGPEDIILVDPKIEKILFDVERKLNRPTLVTFKYIPSSKEGLVEWYRRLKFKESVFNGKGLNTRQYPYNLVVASNKADTSNLLSSHIKIFANPEYMVFRK
ncbi:serine protease Do protein [Candidatus Micropelagos thuwalensis]|uniref:Serine protease Do protein n=1 Tax=Candidatus Micropelagius thuwalensis TaxID=1397666 RepID=U2W8Y5_9PROT|nr:DUF6798 domain-containing protein [Candidatus Micropelagos thuwalensis]ERL46054.1 serine protease Do protein [Candidatus Micropelagos thuwalensis]